MNLCSNDMSAIWSFVGYVLLLFKIVIPILLIIWGMLDLGKAVVAAKDDEIKKATKSFAMRLIAGVIVFFIPTIVTFVFSIVSGFGEVEGEYDTCVNCINNPASCK